MEFEKALVLLISVMFLSGSIFIPLQFYIEKRNKTRLFWVALVIVGMFGFIANALVSTFAENLPTSFESPLNQAKGIYVDDNDRIYIFLPMLRKIQVYQNNGSFIESRFVDYNGWLKDHVIYSHSGKPMNIVINKKKIVTHDGTTYVLKGRFSTSVIKKNEAGQEITIITSPVWWRIFTPHLSFLYYALGLFLLTHKRKKPFVKSHN